MRKKNKRGFTTIAVTLGVKRRLDRLKRHGETFSELIERLLNKKGQVGTLFIIIIAVVIIGILYLVLGTAVDEFISVTNDIAIAPSEYRYNALTFLQTILAVAPIIFAFVIIVYGIKNAAERRTREV